MSDKKLTSLELWEKLSKVNDKIRKVQARQMFEEKLTTPQFGVLEILYKRGPLPLKKISDEMMVTGANITCVVDNLEKENLVRRIPSKEDRRVIHAELTPQGKNKIDSIYPAYTKNIAEMFSLLSESEQKELLKLLSKIL
jgi:MarR family 2-MHQ and catechol resistance regulon transcriptional repressor